MAVPERLSGAGAALVPAPLCGTCAETALKFPKGNKNTLASPRKESISTLVDAPARAAGPLRLCNDVPRPFWQNRSTVGRSREGGQYGCYRPKGVSTVAIGQIRRR